MIRSVPSRTYRSRSSSTRTSLSTSANIARLPLEVTRTVLAPARLSRQESLPSVSRSKPWPACLIVAIQHAGHGFDLDTEGKEDRKSTRLNSSHGYISYAVFCLKKK